MYLFSLFLLKIYNFKFVNALNLVILEGFILASIQSKFLLNLKMFEFACSFYKICYRNSTMKEKNVK